MLSNVVAMYRICGFNKIRYDYSKSLNFIKNN